jgi:hypothetical protein
MQIMERSVPSDHVLRHTEVVSITGMEYIVSTVGVSDEYRMALADVGMSIPDDCAYQTVVVPVMDPWSPTQWLHAASDVEADMTHHALVMNALTETFTEE